MPEYMPDHRRQRLGGKTVSPIFGVEDVADLRQAIAAGLADCPPVTLDDPVVAERRIGSDHVREPLAGFFQCRCGSEDQ
jgi:hypothetical protein